MFRGRWGVFLAIVGIAVLGALLVASYSLYDSAQQQHSSYGYQPAGKPLLGASTVTPGPAQPYQPYCQNPESREDADLCAQWAAVEQVTESNRIASTNTKLAILTLLITVFGTGLLLWTFDDNRETSRRQLRAYVYFTDSDKPFPVPITRDSRLWFALKNGGSTQAIDLKIRRTAEIVKRPIGDHVVAWTDEPEPLAGIPPNSTLNFYIDLDEIPIPDFARLLDGDVLLWRLRVDYKTVFGNEDFDEQTLVFSKDGMAKGDVVMAGHYERRSVS